MLCILLLHLKTTFWDRIHGTKELKWSSIHWKQDETKVWWSDSRRWGWDKRLWAFSVHFSSVVSYSLWPHEPQHARPPCPSPTQWTWIWVNSRSWWWTGRPGMLRFMRSQRVGHDWTELNLIELILIQDGLLTLDSTPVLRKFIRNACKLP